MSSQEELLKITEKLSYHDCKRVVGFLEGRAILCGKILLWLILYLPEADFMCLLLLFGIQF